MPLPQTRCSKRWKSRRQRSYFYWSARVRIYYRRRSSAVASAGRCTRQRARTRLSGSTVRVSIMPARSWPPLAARLWPRAQDPPASARRFMLDQLAAGAPCDAFACGERLQKAPVSDVLGWLQRWLYDLLAQYSARRPRYYPGEAEALKRCAQSLNTRQLLRYLRHVNAQRAVEHHPLNTRLVIEVMYSEYRALFSEPVHKL